MKPEARRSGSPTSSARICAQHVIDAGMRVVLDLLEEDRERLCGPRYVHQAGRKATRWGHVDGSLAFGGRRVTIRRPRAQSTDGSGEVALPSWEALSCEDPLHERAVEQMLVGVTTRRYARSLEPMPPGVAARGTSKSAVSRRFVASTQKQIDELLTRDPGSMELLMVDGVHLSNHVMLVALGIEASGKKRVLGVREGATENAASCKALLSDLVERGLPADRSILVVIDGGKALAKAVNSVFGGYAILQRCQAHKARNVVEQLPQGARAAVRAAIRQAYRTRDPKASKRLLQNLHRRLAEDHPGAAASLAEGLDETLSIKQFRLPEWAERTLSTTHAIENVMGSIRRMTRRVKKWKNGARIVRWTVAALLDAEKRFHRVRDHVGLKKLAAALRDRDAVRGGVEARADVA